MGAIQVHEGEYTISVVGGTGSVTIPYVHGILNQIVVTPASESDTFSFKVLNRYNRKVMDVEGLTGSTDRLQSIALRGRPTITIYDSTPATSTYQVYVSLVDHN